MVVVVFVVVVAPEAAAAAELWPLALLLVLFVLAFGSLRRLVGESASVSFCCGCTCFCSSHAAAADGFAVVDGADICVFDFVRERASKNTTCFVRRRKREVL